MSQSLSSGDAPYVLSRPELLSGDKWTLVIVSVEWCAVVQVKQVKQGNPPSEPTLSRRSSCHPCFIEVIALPTSYLAPPPVLAQRRYEEAEGVKLVHIMSLVGFLCFRSYVVGLTEVPPNHILLKERSYGTHLGIV